MTPAPVRAPVATDQAPPAIGPYSQAIRHGDVLYCAGQIPLDPAGELVTGSLAEETRRCLDNVTAVCAAASGKLGDAVRVTIYTTALDQLAEINEAYASYFGEVPPARVLIGVAALPLGARIEVEATVALQS